MHIITHRRIVAAQQTHPQSASALEQWYRLCKKADWRNFAELRALFPSTDKVGDLFVFDIGGNKLRLIAAIHFNARRVFIRAVLTHKEYDQGDWK
jgi:mRNA interferase HigB